MLPTTTDRQLNSEPSVVDVLFILDGGTESSSSESSAGCASEGSTVISDSDKDDDTDRPYPCPFPGCKQRFKRSYTLKDHINVHTGERPFVCPVSTCRRSFATSGNLSRHKRIHPWLDKPLQCLVHGCGCEFNSETKLERHLRSHFGKSSDHQCTFPLCGKVFSTPGNLRRHIRINHRNRSRGAPAGSSATVPYTSSTRPAVQWVPVTFPYPLQVYVDANHQPQVHIDCLEPACDQEIFEALSSLFEDDEETVEFVTI